MRPLRTIAIALPLTMLTLGGAMMIGCDDSGATTQPTKAPALGNPLLGKQVAMRPNINCVFCHSDDGTVGQGPSFKGLYGSVVKYDDGSTVLLDDKTIRAALKNPAAKIMEGFEPRMPTDLDGKLTEEDKLNLIAYLRKLGVQQ